MKYFIEFSLLVFFLLLGEIANQISGIPIPSSVFGMIFLFLALYFKIIDLNQIEETSSVLLNNILLFFVPIGVSIMVAFDIIQADWWKILIIVAISTFVVMAFTSLTVQLLSKQK